MKPDELMEEAGLLKTVYSFVMPETESLIDEVLGSVSHRQALRDRHREAWTGKQDYYHDEFFSSWLRWVNPAASFRGLKRASRRRFFRYPTAGSSEGIREVIAQHASLSNYRPAHGVPVLHVLAGEYEGYSAYAESYGMRVVEHEGREAWQITESIEASLEHMGVDGTGHLFFISQPSSIDGMLRDNNHILDIFEWLQENTGVRVAVDLCYVGTFGEHATEKRGRVAFDLYDGPCEVVDYICFSLSKVFGLYYHRIGGIFSRKEMPGLYGNKWFKNLTSLYLACEFMRRYSVFELPDRYAGIQTQAIDKIKAELMAGSDAEHDGGGFNPKPADVFLLANERISNDNWKNPIPQRFLRGTSATGSARYCLTKKMHEIATAEGLYTELKGDEDA